MKEAKWWWYADDECQMMVKPHITLVVSWAKNENWLHFFSRNNKMNCEHYMIPPLFGKQEVGIWCAFPRYGVPIWSLWPNIRSLPSIVAEKNVMKNVHIWSMCIKTNLVGKQEVRIWLVQIRYPEYGVPIWSLWLIIRFLSSIVADKNATKN